MNFQFSNKIFTQKSDLLDSLLLNPKNPRENYSSYINAENWTKDQKG
jgi:hypothetical protein